jgi:hypothetical protein
VQAAALNDILDWGGMKPLAVPDRQRVLASLPLLDQAREAGAPLRAVYARRIASVSKVYATYDPDHWVIFDSRVGFALARLVGQWWQSLDDQPADTLLRFPTPPAQKERAVEGFPSLGADAGNQARLGFCFASWLCRGLAERLNGQPGPQEGWRPVHVEMVLFTLGGEPLHALQLQAAQHPSSEGNTMVDPASAAGAKTAAKKIATRLAASEAASRGKDAAYGAISEQVDRIKAKTRAIKYAQQTGGRLALLQFADGGERWVVFKDGKPIAAFPEFAGNLEEALTHHSKIRTRLPRSVKATLPASKTKKVLLQARQAIPKPRMPFRKRDDGTGSETDSS